MDNPTGSKDPEKYFFRLVLFGKNAGTQSNPGLICICGKGGFITLSIVTRQTEKKHRHRRNVLSYRFMSFLFFFTSFLFVQVGTQTDIWPPGSLVINLATKVAPLV